MNHYTHYCDLQRRVVSEPIEDCFICTAIMRRDNDIASLRAQLQEAQESAARAENAWKNAEAELRKNGIDGNGIVDALIFGFNMVYTSPAWGDDERSPEGWKQKEAALRKEFSATVKKAITLFMVFLEFAKERLRVKDDCLQVKVKEVAILRTALAAAEERADRAEKRSQFNKDNHLAAEKEIDRLSAELSTLRRTSVRVDVLLRLYENNLTYESYMQMNDRNSVEVKSAAAKRTMDAVLLRLTRRSTANTKGADSTRRAEDRK